jgi:hypothetical protein
MVLTLGGRSNFLRNECACQSHAVFQPRITQWELQTSHHRLVMTRPWNSIYGGHKLLPLMLV